MLEKHIIRMRNGKEVLLLFNAVFRYIGEKKIPDGWCVEIATSQGPVCLQVEKGNLSRNSKVILGVWYGYTGTEEDMNETIKAFPSLSWRYFAGVPSLRFEVQDMDQVSKFLNHFPHLYRSQ